MIASISLSVDCNVAPLTGCFEVDPSQHKINENLCVLIQGREEQYVFYLFPCQQHPLGSYQSASSLHTSCIFLMSFLGLEVRCP